MIRVMTEWGGGHRGQCNRFPGICLTTEENPGKPQLGNRRGAHSSATSHCFKWGPFPQNEADRITLPAPLVKPIQVRPEKRAEKKLDRGSEHPEISGEPLRATPQKFRAGITVTIPAPSPRTERLLRSI